MAEIKGLVGFRPSKESVSKLTCPPYDVIKQGTELSKSLFANQDSLVQVTLGSDPTAALSRLISEGIIVEDNEPCFYVYEQTYGNKTRTGFFAATEVSPYSTGIIRRHEKTFDDKVRGRLELQKKTGLTLEPIFLLTKSKIGEVLEKAKRNAEYEFTSEFFGETDLNHIKNRVFRITEESNVGAFLKHFIKQNPLYIADGHHRYHTSLLNGQSHCLAYITEEAEIQAYNRVINPPVPFEEARNHFDLAAADAFKTPGKHEFCIYVGGKPYLVRAKQVPGDVVGRLDCSILEREVYPALGLKHEMIRDEKIFDYYPESQLQTMMAQVDSGKYRLAIALHPVSIDELMAVADTGLQNAEIVMPEKSTFFSPKILSGIIIFRH